MPKTLVLSQITLCADGSIGLQWLKQITDPDDGSILSAEPHRAVVDFDGDVETVMTQALMHLRDMGFPTPVGSHMVALVKKIDAAAQTDHAITTARSAKIRARAQYLSEAAGGE